MRARVEKLNPTVGELFRKPEVGHRLIIGDQFMSSEIQKVEELPLGMDDINMGYKAKYIVHTKNSRYRVEVWE